MEQLVGGLYRVYSYDYLDVLYIEISGMTSKLYSVAVREKD